MNEAPTNEELIKIHNRATGERDSGSEEKIIERYEIEKKEKEIEHMKGVKKANAEYWLETYSDPKSDFHKELTKVAEGKGQASESLTDIIEGWDYLDLETKQLVATAFPELAKLVLYKKMKGRDKVEY